MKWLFFDLETSGLHRVDQILTYCFILTDDKFKQIDKKSGAVKLNPFTLPSPYAIYCNKLDLYKHQKTSIPEHRAMLDIFDFLQKLSDDEDIFLSGYNIASFDVPLLKASLKKYGLNWPNFNKFHINDLYTGLKKLKATNQQFADTLKRHKIKNLKLCSFVQFYLGEEQDHSADGDIGQVVELYGILEKSYWSLRSMCSTSMSPAYIEESTRNGSSFSLKTDIEDSLHSYPEFDEDYSTLARAIYSVDDGAEILKENKKLLDPNCYTIMTKLYWRYLINTSHPKKLSSDIKNVVSKFLRYKYGGDSLMVSDIYKGVIYYPGLSSMVGDLTELLNDHPTDDIVLKLLKYYNESKSIELLSEIDMFKDTCEELRNLAKQGE